MNGFSLAVIGIDKGTLKWHLLAWLIYVLYACSIIIPYPDIFITDVILANIVSVFCFYSCMPFLGKFGNRQYIPGFLLLVVSVLLFFLFRALLYYIFTESLNRRDVPSVYSKQFWIEGLYIYIHFLLNALGYYFLKRSADRQKIIRLVSEEKAQIQRLNNELEKKVILEEKMRDVAEANFLRAQINPHFLQNTLNFLYAQSISGNTESLSEGILLLSEMMRYSLQNQGDSNVHVALKDEVQHIRNYIDINQLRFNGKLQIKLTIDGIPGSYTIIPLVLLTLLENAFKYGDLNDKDSPLIIKLTFVADTGMLCFELRNKITTGPVERSTGIGIENTRRRLDTAYPGNYNLESYAADGHYTTKLGIRLRKLPAE